MTSYAKPSDFAEHVVESPAARHSLMPVNSTICPFLLALKVGSTALIIFTGPKKFVSNWLRTSVRVSGEAESSSTVPTTAICMPSEPAPISTRYPLRET